MFDFDKTFQKKNDNGIDIPPEYVHYLSQNAPKGTEYVATDEGFFFLSPIDDQFSIGGFHFELSPDQQADLGDQIDPKSVEKYMYNSQQAILLKPDKPGCLIINGKEVSVNKIVQSPLLSLKPECGSLVMTPQRFPPPFQLTISNNEFNRSVIVVRKPNRSIDEELYESATEDPLSLQYLHNPNANKISMSMNFSYSKAKSVKDVVECMELYNSLCKGEVKINGEPFPFASKGRSYTCISDDTIYFWRKVLALEEVLGVNFVLPASDPGIETILDIETLYQGLVNNLPTITRTQIDSFTNSIDGVRNETVEDGKEIAFEMRCYYETTILGQEIKLPSIVMVFNAIISRREIIDGNQVTYLADVSDKKKRFTSILPFLDFVGLKTFLGRDWRERFELFESAHRPSELI